jgi:site-specific DNA recombinase
LRLARSKAFDKLVVFRYDRSGRDDVEYFGMLKDFTKLGIDLVSASGESPDPFYQKVAGLLAWNESRTLSIRVTGSKMKRFNGDKWNGKPLLGYDVRRLEQGGAVLVPSDQASLVTEMFRRYATGKHSLSDLRDFLNEAGVLRSRHGIQYILVNQVYLGMVPHGKNPTSPFNPKPELTWSKGQHQPLIDQETFDKVQVRLAENKSRQRGGTAPRYLFSGLVYCGGCGRKYIGRYKSRGDKRWNQYNCGRKHNVGDCPGRKVYESHIKAAVIPPIEALLGKLKQADIRAAVREELAHQDKATIQGTLQVKESLAEKQQRLENRLSNLEDDYLDRTISKERYLKRRDEILAQLEEIRGQLAAKPHLALPDVEQVLAIADTITLDTLDDLAWRDIIEGMVDRIVIEDHEIKVIWKPAYEPLLNLVAKGGV